MNSQLAGLVLLGLLAGCGSGDDSGRVVTSSDPSTGQAQPDIPAPPLARDDAYTVREGSPLIVSGAGVTANDTTHGATASLATPPQLGQLILHPDGSFTYTPSLGVADATDTFRYTLQNGRGSYSATVTLTIEVTRFHVKNNGPNGNGRYVSPFNNLADAVSAASATTNAEIVLFQGDSTSARQDIPITLLPGQTLRSLDPARRATITGPVVLADRSHLSDLLVRHQDMNRSAISAREAGDFTLANLDITAPYQAVNFTNVHGQVTLDSLECASTLFMRLDNLGGALTVQASNLTHSGSQRSVVFAGGGAEIAWHETGARCERGTAVPNGYFFFYGYDETHLDVRLSDCRVSGSTGGTEEVILVSGLHSTLRSVIENCSFSAGIAMDVSEQSDLKARIQNTSAQGECYFQNAPQSPAAMRLTGVSASSYLFQQIGPDAPFFVENWNEFGSENEGTVQVGTGVVTHAEIGTLGIP